MHPSQSRPGPAVRGFKPDLIGSALLFLFLVVGHLISAALLWDLDRDLELFTALGVVDFDSRIKMMSVLVESVHVGNFVTGFVIFILAFGVKGRKLVSLVPLVLLLSPFLHTFLADPIFHELGSTDLSRQLFWFGTYGVFYGAALAAWAYGFGRSAAGVVLAGCLGAVALTAHRFLMEWVADQMYNHVGGENIGVVFDILFRLGLVVTVVAVILLSCLAGPGLARAPIALEPRYRRPVAPPQHQGGAQPRGAASWGSVSGEPESSGSPSWGAADPRPYLKGGQLGSGGSSEF